MITKSDWHAVHQGMTADDRRKLGEPPTAEQLLAYSEGTLADDEAERVRAWLVCNPELARALMEPFPDDDAKPGDPGFLSETELAKQWASLQQRIHGSSVPRPEGHVLPFRNAWLGLAAAVALVFAGLFWQAESKAQRLERELREPRVLETMEIFPDHGSRGAGESSTLLTAKGDVLLLDVMLSNASRFDRYRVEMTGMTAKQPASPWKSPTIRPGNDEVLSIMVPRAYLKPGQYRIVVFGIDGAREERLDTYTLRVPSS